MPSHRSGEGRCPDTGLAVPECSCKRCLEAMLRRFQPDLLAGEIRITRLAPPRADDGPRGRRAA